MSTRQDTRPRNGSPAAAEAAARVAEAVAYEVEIAAEAAQIRQRARDLTKSSDLTPELFMQLLPLLRRPIPDGFITTTPAVKGKPYESTGIKSLQVQVNRMDNVLTPLWWEWETIYSDEGRLAHVIVFVGPKANPLVRREARGGVSQASTQGNLYKGSETNAAKLAFARLGPGHEVYTGATDLDPDVDPDAANAQANETVGAEPQARVLTVDEVERVDTGIHDAGLWDEVGTKLRSLGLDDLVPGEVTTDHAFALHEWIQERQREKASDQSQAEGAR